MPWGFHLSSAYCIIKGAALRSLGMFSTVEDFKMNMAKLVKPEFAKVFQTPSNGARETVEQLFKNKMIFTSTFNLQDPNVAQIINHHLHLIKDTPFLSDIFPDDSICAANKRFQNLKYLLTIKEP